MALKTIVAKRPRLNSLLISVWLFPLILVILLILMTALKITGSSIGVYHTFFYGKAKDPALLVGRPRQIRSDEWLVFTQMSMAQKNNGFKQINPNVGQGEDVSLLLDGPYKDWSQAFKPHNLAFFVLPFDNAFAFKWWFMAFSIIISCYFFVLALLPRRRLLASLLALAFFFSPFLQWWFTYGTIGCVYYALFGLVIFIKLLEEKRRSWQIIWSLLLAYVLTAFAMLLYPPFQICTALVAGVFAVGFLVEKFRKKPWKDLLKKLGFLAFSAALSAVVLFIFFSGRQSTVNTITHTAYPGQRVVFGGGYDPIHFMSGHLSVLLQFGTRANQYKLPQFGIMNQSEAANFILLQPFLLIPSFWLLARGYKRKKLDWPLLATNVLFLVLLVRLFARHFQPIYKLLLLHNVPLNRLIMAFGFLSIIHLVLFIRNLSQEKKWNFNRWATYLYVFAVFVLEVGVGLVTKHRLPAFIKIPELIVLALPIPVITYLLLTKRFALAIAGLLMFSVFSAGIVNPLYRGTAVVSQSALSKEIQAISTNKNEKWLVESGLYENFPAANNAPSLSGTYTYPQLSLWAPIDNGTHQEIYNRYAHVNFELDRQSENTVPTTLKLVGGDNFVVETEPCSPFIKDNQVRYLIVEKPLSPNESCLSLVKQINYPASSFFIYHLN